MNIPKKGFYVHYKHDPAGAPNNYMYEVIGVGRNTEEETFTVLYRPLYPSDWMPPADFQSRPIEMFFDQVQKGETKVLRFSLIEDPEIVARLEVVKLTETEEDAPTVKGNVKHWHVFNIIAKKI